MDQKIRVKFAGGREVFGTLKGFDQLMNLVMDEVTESLRDDEGNVTDKTRNLGLVVLRGTALTVINPADGFESIEKYVCGQQRGMELTYRGRELTRIVLLFVATPVLSHRPSKE